MRRACASYPLLINIIIYWPFTSAVLPKMHTHMRSLIERLHGFGVVNPDVTEAASNRKPHQNDGKPYSVFQPTKITISAL